RPWVTNLTVNLELEPAPGQQLDSVTRLYLARLTVSHLDRASPTPVPGNSAATLTARLLHFNGNLYFGTVQTRFTSIDNVPAALSLVPGSHLFCRLGIDGNSGFVVGHPQ